MDYRLYHTNHLNPLRMLLDAYRKGIIKEQIGKSVKKYKKEGVALATPFNLKFKI